MLLQRTFVDDNELYPFFHILQRLYQVWRSQMIFNIIQYLVFTPLHLVQINFCIVFYNTSISFQLSLYTCAFYAFPFKALMFNFRI